MGGGIVHRGLARRPAIEVTGAAGPPLSVVVVTWNAATRLSGMLAGLTAQAIDGVELVVVDNASVDGSAELVEREWPDAIIECQHSNLGFAAAAARGFDLSSGAAVALLNYDVVLGQGYLRACLAELKSRPGLGSVQGLLLRPGGGVVDSAGHQVSRGRWFRNRGENQRVGARVWAPADVFGVTGAAAVYRRAMLEDVAAVTGGLFDPAFFAYLEDVDLDCRARWRGWESAVVAGATAEHERSGSGGRAAPSIQRHIVKNRLLVLYRNEDSGSLLRDLPWVGGQMLARLGYAAVTAPSSLLGVADFLRLVPGQREARRAIRGTRRVSPTEVRRWFGADADGSFATRTGAPASGPDAGGPRRLLIVCGEPLGERMAGPAIRALELGRAVAATGIEVTVAAPRGAGQAPLSQGMRQVSLTRAALRAELAAHDCVLVGASLLSRFPQLLKATIPLAVDLYVPVPLEAAELFRDRAAPVRWAILAEAEATLRLELARADAVFCASERQRDLYSGFARGDGRADLDKLVRVVPFGVPEEPPRARTGRLRLAIPGAAPEDPVVLWGGGLHDWFDPELVVHAVADLAEEIPGIRLVFLGADPPNVNLIRHGAAARAAAAALERGVVGINVFFLQGWVPYAKRGDYFGDADLGVSAHRAGPETTYSWRTRLLDYAWAGLPVAATSGDELSARLEAAGAAELAEPGDRASLRAALRRLLVDPARRARASEGARSVARDLRWTSVAEPLVEWVLHPVVTHTTVSRWPATVALWRMFAFKSVDTLLHDGPRALAQRAARFTDRSA